MDKTGSKRRKGPDDFDEPKKRCKPDPTTYRIVDLSKHGHLFVPTTYPR